MNDKGTLALYVNQVGDVGLWSVSAYWLTDEHPPQKMSIVLSDLSSLDSEACQALHGAIGSVIHASVGASG